MIYKNAMMITPMRTIMISVTEIRITRILMMMLINAKSFSGTREAKAAKG